jgi:RimJ/RimL family protein N-acetyltransferase
VKAPLIFAGGTLTTARLSLEPLAVAHATPMFEGFSDPALYRWINAEPPTSVADLQQRFDRIAHPYAPNGALWLNWAARLAGGGAYVGLFEATVRPDRVAFLAYYVFTAHARQGIAREGCATIIAHLWRAYDATEVRADVDFRNVPARCLVESLSFVRRSRNIAATLRGEPSIDYRYRQMRPVS